MTRTKQFGPTGWTPERLGSLAGKTYVVTGTTTGTGFEATRQFLSKGARVVMLNRSPERAAGVLATLTEEFGSDAKVTSIHMDLAEQDSVRRAAAEVLEVAPRIDSLICNAAIAQIAVQEITEDGVERHFGVNHLGHFLLCGLLFDRVEASDGRIVVVGSLAYKQGLKRIKFEDMNFDDGYTPWDAYAHSKLAQMMFGYELQRRVAAAGKNVTVHVCHPGASHTSLIKGDNLSQLVKTFWTLTAPFIAQSAEKGAYPEVLCSTEDGLMPEALYGPTQRWELSGAVDQCVVAEHVLDREVASKLWALSEQHTSLRWAV